MASTEKRSRTSAAPDRSHVRPSRRVGEQLAHRRGERLGREVGDDDARSAAEQVAHAGHRRRDHRRAGGQRLEHRDRLPLGVRGHDAAGRRAPSARARPRGRRGTSPRERARALRAVGRRPTTANCAPSTSAAACEEALRVLDRREPADEQHERRARPASRRAAAARETPLWITTAPPGTATSSDTHTTCVGRAHEQPRRRRPVGSAPRRGGSPAPAGAAARARAGRRPPRPPSPSRCARARRAGGSADERGLARATHSSTPAGERPRSGSVSRRTAAGSSASSGPGAPDTATS